MVPGGGGTLSCGRGGGRVPIPTRENTLWYSSIYVLCGPYPSLPSPIIQHLGFGWGGGGGLDIYLMSHDSKEASHSSLLFFHGPRKQKKFFHSLKGKIYIFSYQQDLVTNSTETTSKRFFRIYCTVDEKRASGCQWHCRMQPWVRSQYPLTQRDLKIGR